MDNVLSFNADDLKKKGNFEFKNKRYQSALSCWSSAISMISENNLTKAKLYSNCSLVWFLEKNYLSSNNCAFESMKILTTLNSLEEDVKKLSNKVYIYFEKCFDLLKKDMTGIKLKEEGNKYFKNNCFKFAIKTYSEGIKQCDDNNMISSLYFNSGLCFEKLNERKFYVFNYNKSLQYNPKHKKSLKRLIKLHNVAFLIPDSHSGYDEEDVSDKSIKSLFEISTLNKIPLLTEGNIEIHGEGRPEESSLIQSWDDDISIKLFSNIIMICYKLSFGVSNFGTEFKEEKKLDFNDKKLITSIITYFLNYQTINKNKKTIIDQINFISSSMKEYVDISNKTYSELFIILLEKIKKINEIFKDVIPEEYKSLFESYADIILKPLTTFNVTDTYFIGCLYNVLSIVKKFKIDIEDSFYNQLIYNEGLIFDETKENVEKGIKQCLKETNKSSGGSLDQSLSFPLLYYRSKVIFSKINNGELPLMKFLNNLLKLSFDIIKLNPTFKKFEDYIKILIIKDDLSMKDNLAILSDLYKLIVFDMRNEICISKTNYLCKKYSYKKIIIKSGASHINDIKSGLKDKKMLCITISNELSKSINPYEISFDEFKLILKD